MDKKFQKHPMGEENPKHQVRKPYEPPRVEKRRSLQQVTLASGMGQAAVGVINVMN